MTINCVYKLIFT